MCRCLGPAETLRENQLQVGRVEPGLHPVQPCLRSDAVRPHPAPDDETAGQCCGSGSTGSTCFWASRIRIHLSEICIRILLSQCKNSKKNLDSYYFVTLFDFLSLKIYVNVASKSNKQKKYWNKNCFLLASLRSMTKIAGSESISQRHGSADPDPPQIVMDPQHCCRPSWIRSTRSASRGRGWTRSWWTSSSPASTGIPRPGPASGKTFFSGLLSIVTRQAFPLKGPAQHQARPSLSPSFRSH